MVEFGSFAEGPLIPYAKGEKIKKLYTIVVKIMDHITSRTICSTLDGKNFGISSKK